MDPAGLGFLLGFLGLLAGVSCLYVYEWVQQRRHRPLREVSKIPPVLVGHGSTQFLRKKHWKVKMILGQRPPLIRQKGLRKIELTV